jgi:hypothetical protein
MHDAAGYRPPDYPPNLPNVPADWKGRAADNSRGVIYQKPGSFGNADSIRIMRPTSSYPQGYLRYYNGLGQPLDVDGQPGSPAVTHIPLDYSGPWPGWPS